MFYKRSFRHPVELIFRMDPKLNISNGSDHLCRTRDGRKTLLCVTTIYIGWTEEKLFRALKALVQANRDPIVHGCPYKDVVQYLSRQKIFSMVRLILLKNSPREEYFLPIVRRVIFKSRLLIAEWTTDKLHYRSRTPILSNIFVD